MENLLLWIISAVIAIGVPAAMLTIGKKIMAEMPKIGTWYGYNSKLSLKNEETWKFANDTMAKLWINIGEAMTPAAAIAMIFSFGKDKSTIWSYFYLLILVELVALIYSKISVKNSLKKEFGE